MLIDKILDKNGSIKEIDPKIALEIINADDIELEKLQQLCLSLTRKEFGNLINSYYPGLNFPSISITGNKCALNCKHCNRHYLESMIPATTPQKLLKICNELNEKGATGCLISGGFDNNAKLPFEKFLDVLREIKNSTDLILNLHTGLITEDLAIKLGEIGIDLVSFDITTDNYIINKIYGLNKSPNDYINSLNWLLESKIRFIAPHICIGLNPKNIMSEFQSLSVIKRINPSIIVLIAFIPTRGTAMENSPAPTPNFISKIICLTRLMFPKSEISLGCMRPKSGQIKYKIEKYAINSGVSRIVLPARKIINYILSKNYTIKRFNTCCAIPSDLLKKIK